MQVTHPLPPHQEAPPPNPFHGARWPEEDRLWPAQGGPQGPCREAPADPPPPRWVPGLGHDSPTFHLTAAVVGTSRVRRSWPSKVHTPKGHSAADPHGGPKLAAGDVGAREHAPSEPHR